MAESKKLTVNPLVVIVIVAAFAIGYLFSRVQSLEQKLGGGGGQAANTQQDSGSPVEEAKDVDKVTKSDHIRGDLGKAKVALIEYSDFECPFCKQFHATAQQAVDEYDGQLVWIWRHFPIEQLHSKAPKEAEASECVFELGGDTAFWKFADRIFEVSPGNNGLDLTTLPDIAEFAGVSRSEFQKCLDSGKQAKKVQEGYQSGVRAGVSGTPGNILMNLKTGQTQLIPGAVPLDSLKTAIDKML